MHCLQDTSDLLIKEECSTTECPLCFSTKEVCLVCKEKGFEHWCPALRRCDRCLEKGVQCTRAVYLNITTDCQAIFKAALELLQKNQGDRTADSYSTLAAPNPDIIHAGKNVHRSHCNWFMFIERVRFSVVMLRTARLGSSCSKDLKAVLTDVALRGRDRMDTSDVAECNRPLARSCHFEFQTRLDGHKQCTQNKLCILKLACALFLPVQPRFKSKMSGA